MDPKKHTRIVIVIAVLFALAAGASYWYFGPVAAIPAGIGGIILLPFFMMMGMRRKKAADTTP